jgi:hypothetical protein
MISPQVRHWSKHLRVRKLTHWPSQHPSRMIDMPPPLRAVIKD